jgi:hypothetical protein
MKALYCYFGLIKLNDIDSPGHSLYQLGLLDSIKSTWSTVNEFDFYSYYPNDVIKAATIHDFPKSPHGELFTKYYNQLISTEVDEFADVLENIRAHKYTQLFLKARFRNLSTLHKKWKDAREFELIIQTAVDSGYSKDQIIILDTDLSLPDNFSEKYGSVITIIIPSIDIPGISVGFLDECIKINGDFSKELLSVFYGNINTSNYKIGNSKGAILNSSLHTMFELSTGSFLIAKPADTLEFSEYPNVYNCNRRDRENIFDLLSCSNIMLNVTKDKYSTARFIPARIFEAMIFGMIPISYNFEFLCPAFSFNEIDDLIEIYKYLQECDADGIKQAYQYFVKSYFDYAESIPTQIFNCDQAIENIR